MIYVVIAAILLAFGAGIFVGTKLPKAQIAEQKLQKIALELENIETTEERRVIVPIMRVTARIKSLL